MPYKGKGKSKSGSYSKRKQWVKKNRKATYGSVQGAREVAVTGIIKPMVLKPAKWTTHAGDLPDKVLMKLGFSDDNNSIAPGTVYGSYAWGINDIYDPDHTGGSKHCNLYNALATLFGKYKVLGCHVKMTIRNVCASPLVCGFLATDRVVTGSMTGDMIMRSCHISAVVPPTGQSNNLVTFDKYIPFKSLIGPKFMDSAYEGTITTSPTDIIWGQVFCYPQNGTTQVLANISTKLVFYTELLEPIYDRNEDT